MCYFHHMNSCVEDLAERLRWEVFLTLHTLQTVALWGYSTLRCCAGKWDWCFVSEVVTTDSRHKKQIKSFFIICRGHVYYIAWGTARCIIGNPCIIYRTGLLGCLRGWVQIHTGPWDVGSRAEFNLIWVDLKRLIWN